MLGYEVQGWVDLDGDVVRQRLAVLTKAVVGQAHETRLLVLPCAGEIAFEANLVDCGSSPSVK